MNRWICAAVSLLLALTLAGCCGPGPVEGPVEGGTGEEREPQAEGIPYEEQVASITPRRTGDVAAQKAGNENVVGWLTVPGTTIDDPVLQNPPMYNDYYTTHNFDGEPDPQGTYGADHRCAFSPGTRADISRNTVLYAHNLDEDPDGILFAQLKKYLDPEFARRNPYLFFSTADEDLAFEVFAVYDTTVDVPYIAAQPRDYIFGPLIDYALAGSVYDYGIAIGPEDKILTLSTCSYDVPGVGELPVHIQNDYRFVVQARLVDPGERRRTEAEFENRGGQQLLPDEMEWPEDDMILLGDSFYTNSEYYYTRIRGVLPLDSSRAELSAEINMTRPALPVVVATLLPEGTQLYRSTEYPDVLFAEVEGDRVPYARVYGEGEEAEVYSYIFRVIGADGRIETEKVFLDPDDFADLDRYIDMVHATQLEERAIEIPQNAARIEAQVRTSWGIWGQTFFLDQPGSVGREVLVVNQFDGYYYFEPELFERMAEAIKAL